MGSRRRESQPLSKGEHAPLVSPSGVRHLLLLTESDLSSRGDVGNWSQESPVRCCTSLQQRHVASPIKVTIQIDSALILTS